LPSFLSTKQAPSIFHSFCLSWSTIVTFSHNWQPFIVLMDNSAVQRWTSNGQFTKFWKG
jgi:hypothetical protein